MSSPRPAWLVLEDGTAFRARSVGADGEVFGELVFNTAMTGYQEVLTDPSYKGQLVCMTYPHIGNYGVNEDDAESRRPWLEGFIIRQCSPIASNFRSQESLEAYLTRHRLVAVDGVDTRALTLTLRQHGSMRGGISTTESDPTRLLDRVRHSPSILGVDLVQEVTCDAPYAWPPGSQFGAAANGPHSQCRDGSGVPNQTECFCSVALDGPLIILEGGDQGGDRRLGSRTDLAKRNRYAKSLLHC